MNGFIRVATRMAAFLVILLNAQIALACDDGIAVLESAEGRIEVRPAGSEDWQPAPQDSAFCAGDSVRVPADSRAVVVMTLDQTLLRLDQNTTITFTPPRNEGEGWLQLLEGAVHFISRTPRPLNVETPYVNAAVEGTEFVVRIVDGRTEVLVFEGQVTASNDHGSVTLGSGQGATADAESAPRPALVPPASDAVRWALYYPPLLDLTAGSATDEQLHAAAADYRRGDAAAAIARLDAEGDDDVAVERLLARAALRLAVGRVDDAQVDLSRLRQLRPDDGRPLALLSVIALVRGVDNAHELADTAVELSGDSAMTWIALSFAQQASGEVDGALVSARTALERDRSDPLVWARVAELELSRGALNAARDASAQAISLEPGLARTQSVAGFVHLARLELEDARESFTRARKIDQGDPLTRLGRGLIEIRRGALPRGRLDMEVAASLDPSNSLIRSYLGKAYFEELRNDEAAKQFALAKEYDPNDPTPWFYDAILKQTENRPVEALRDLQASIDRNDNRAVYRSRLLLDQDVAARNASQSRIYRDLGFEQRAEVIATQSLAEDPANHAGHRLLSDVYASKSRHTTARVSELLQSQMLQPLSLTALQPQLSEANLGILSGAGPSELATNEYNRLFVQEGTLVQMNALAGSNNTWGDDVVVAGLWDKWAISVGQFAYRTDGVRENADRALDSYNALIQYSPDPSTNLQLELRHSERDEGDITTLAFQPQRFDETLRNVDESDYARIGWRQQFGPGRMLLLSAGHQRWENHVSFSPVPGLTVVQGGPIDTSGMELQYISRSAASTLISGLNAVSRRDRGELTISDGGGNQVFDRGADIQSGALYTYAFFPLPQDIELVAGLSLDYLDENPNTGSGKQWSSINPKLGFTWRPNESWTLRLVALRALARPLLADQTLEPTQVAGFNQLYDSDSRGTESWQYGAAVDGRLADNLYWGADAKHRQLSVAYTIGATTPGGGMIREFDAREWSAGSYLSWAASDNMAFNLDYRYETLDQDADGALNTEEGLENLTTQQLRFGAKGFLSEGWTAELATSWVDQAYDAAPPPGPPEPGFSASGGDQFINVDAALRYRMPRRLGELSLEVRNVLDSDFEYIERDRSNPSFYTERFVFARFSLSF